MGLPLLPMPPMRPNSYVSKVTRPTAAEVLAGVPRQNAGQLPRVAVAHDYFTQRGGAERVALALHDGFAHGPLVTSVVRPETTFAELGRRSTRTSWLQRLRIAGRDPRLVLPLLPTAWSGLRVTKSDADVVVTSSTGFAHGVRSDVPKIVYCHNPPRWLYQTDDYLLGQPWAVRTLLRASRRTPSLGPARRPVRRPLPGELDRGRRPDPHGVRHRCVSRAPTGLDRRHRRAGAGRRCR